MAAIIREAGIRIPVSRTGSPVTRGSSWALPEPKTKPGQHAVRPAGEDWSSVISCLLTKLSFQCFDSPFQFVVFECSLCVLDDTLGRPDADIFMFAIKVLHKGFGCLRYVSLEGF